MTKIDQRRVPRHVAIIMDGNGRWAKMRKLPRTQGHYKGARRVEEIIKSANNIGVNVLTLFTFSTENWNRPEKEVNLLMKMVSFILTKKIDSLKRDNIKFNFIGRKRGVPKDLMRVIQWAIMETRHNTGMIVNMAFNYGSRSEIIDTVKEISRAVEKGKLQIKDISEETFSNALYTRGLPDPDLLIRTSGERRISNFLLWQLSYAEFYFTEKFWPDFDEDEFKKAIKDYQSRERRFGNLHSSRKETTAVS